MATYTLQKGQFDGAKFAARYNLDRTKNDYSAIAKPGGTIVIILRDGLKLPDDPPIFEAPPTDEELTKEQLLAQADEADQRAKVLYTAITAVINAINARATEANSKLPPITITDIINQTQSALATAATPTPK